MKFGGCKLKTSSKFNVIWVFGLIQELRKSKLLCINML